MTNTNINQEAELENQIAIARKRLDALRKDSIADFQNQIKQLDWTKDCSARLKIKEYGCLGRGLPKYVVEIFGTIPKAPWHSGGNGIICVMGTDKHYQKNITFFLKPSIGSFPTFETCNDSLLIEFLKTVKFKKLEFDNKDYQVLLTANQLYGDKQE